MADFNAADAGLEGLRLTREHPKAVAIWAALVLASTVLFSAVVIGLAGDAYGELVALQGARNSDPDRALSVLGRLAPAFLVLLPLLLAYYAVFYSAIYRAVLRPDEGGPGFLKLGGDEARVLGATALLVVLAIGFSVGLGILLALLGAVGGLAGEAAAGLIAFLAFLAVLAALVVFAVRFSLALPATFAERRIRVFESWRLTKGRFWPLLGAYALAIALAIIISLLGLMIYFAIAALLAGGVREAASVFSPDYTSFANWFSPAMIIYLVLSSILNALTAVITVAPMAVAYRDLSRGDGAGA